MSAVPAADARAQANAVVPPPPIDNERVSQYWSEQFDKMRAHSGYWLQNNLVVRHIYRLISQTGEEHWLPWLFREHFRDVSRFERLLSICCGDGVHELVAYRTGKVGHVYGFDIAKGAIDQCRERFRSAGVPEAHYQFEVQDANNLKLTGHFDLALAIGSLHHVTNLEGLLSRLSEVLRPAGYLGFVEFVGPKCFSGPTIKSPSLMGFSRV